VAGEEVRGCEQWWCAHTRRGALQAAIIELLEGGGIEGVAVALATPETDSRVLGELLVEAVEAAAKPRASTGTAAAETADDSFSPDLFAGDLPSLETLIGETSSKRLEVRRGAREGVGGAGQEWLARTC